MTKISLAFLVDNLGTLLDLANVTLLKVHYNTIKQSTHSKLALNQITKQNNKTKKCMQACKMVFY